MAFNLRIDVADADGRAASDAIQLQFAARVALGKRPREKAKVSPLKARAKRGRSSVHTPPQNSECRRAKDSGPKSKSKCLRCRGYGRWAAQKKDPPKKPFQPTANVATMSDSSDDDGAYVGAPSSKTPVAIMAVRGIPQKLEIHRWLPMFDNKFLIGQFKG